jgi:uncharacterized protein (TIGR02599 family)
MTSLPPPAARRRHAFTIVELLAATAVFIGLMLMLVTATNQTSEMWRRSSSKIEQFQQARRGFESMTRRISQATLNTYWDYHFPLKAGKPDRSQVPDGYMRQSELRFRSGPSSTLLAGVDGLNRPTHAIFFQAPLGFVDDDVTVRTRPEQSHKPLNNLLNTWGYFLEVNDDSELVPEFLRKTIPPRTRSRLMELMEPSETVKIDNPSSDPASPESTTPVDPNWDNAKYLGWFVDPVKKRTPVRVLSENIIALVILPRLTPQDEAARAKATPPKTELLCPFYDYDSKRLANSAAGINNPATKATDPELNPKNQLPPVVTVAMVAIDETSAQRLAAMSGSDPTLGLELKNLFKEAKKMDNDPQTPTPGDGDLAKLEAQLIEKRLTYRIFVSNVENRGAKWSRWQEN